MWNIEYAWKYYDWRIPQFLQYHFYNYIFTHLSSLEMQDSQKRCPHSVCLGLHNTKWHASQQYFGSGGKTKWSLKPPCRGWNPGSVQGLWTMEGARGWGGICSSGTSTFRPADMTWNTQQREMLQCTYKQPMIEWGGMLIYFNIFYKSHKKDACSTP